MSRIIRGLKEASKHASIPNMRGKKAMIEHAANIKKFLGQLFRHKQVGSDGEDGKAWASPGSFAYGGRGGEGSTGRGGKGGDAVVIGKGSIAVGGKGGDVSTSNPNSPIREAVEAENAPEERAKTLIEKFGFPQPHWYEVSVQDWMINEATTAIREAVEAEKERCAMIARGNADSWIETIRSPDDYAEGRIAQMKRETGLAIEQTIRSRSEKP